MAQSLVSLWMNNWPLNLFLIMCCVFLGSLGPHHIDSVFDIVIEGQGFVVQHTVGTFERVWVLVTLMLHGEEALNHYEGFRPKRGEVCTCPKISLASIGNTIQFEETIMAERRPVIITTDGLHNLGWNTSRWTNEYLTEKAGEVIVRVEVKSGREGERDADKFGQVPDARIQFGEFLRMRAGNDTKKYNYYLNLQSEREGYVMTEPTALLSEDFTLPSFLLRHSVKEINMWMGSSDPLTGATSTAHHDYSDNLYALIQGRKSFTMYPPSESFNLYPRGTIRNIEPGGRVVYVANHAFEPHFSHARRASAEYPRLQQASKCVCALDAGELLYLPTGWWHEVASFGDSMALNFWFDDINVNKMRYIKRMARHKEILKDRKLDRLADPASHFRDSLT